MTLRATDKRICRQQAGVLRSSEKMDIVPANQRGEQPDIAA